MKAKRKLKQGSCLRANERRRLCWRRQHQRLVERRVKWFYQLCNVQREKRDEHAAREPTSDV